MGASSLGSRAIRGAFFARLAIATGASWAPRLAMKMDSDQASETYKFLGQVPQLREWIGARQANGLWENGFTIANKKFEGTLEVLLDEIRRDKTGQVMVRINELASRAAGHDASLLSTLILNGATGVCYDGQYFFDTDHTQGKNTTSQANSIAYDISDGGTSGTPTVPTARTMQAAILAGVAKILGFLDDQNEPCNEQASKFVVMCGPTLMQYVLAAIQAPVLDAGASSIIKNQSEFSLSPSINARLSSWTDKIAVFREDGDVKPFILQEEEGITWSEQAEGSKEEFDNDRHLYGVKKIGNAGYGEWRHACLVTLQA